MGQRSQLVGSSREPTEADIEAMRRKLSTPHRLKALFAPKSVAVVGASDGSGWSRFIIDSLANRRDNRQTGPSSSQASRGVRDANSS